MAIIKKPTKSKPKINPMDKKPKTTASKKKPVKKVAGAGAFYGATKNTKGKKLSTSNKSG